MRDLNIEFQENYKRLDKLCKEMYNSSEGVSSYINDMQCTPSNKQQTVYDWDNVYKQLKHYRWMRNQLAHEIDIDTEFCKKADIDWVKQFYERILKGNDPLSVANKENNMSQKSATKNNINSPTPIYIADNKPRESLWQRIVSKIKSWFS